MKSGPSLAVESSRRFVSMAVALLGQPLLLCHLVQWIRTNLRWSVCLCPGWGVRHGRKWENFPDPKEDLFIVGPPGRRSHAVCCAIYCYLTLPQIVVNFVILVHRQ